MKEQMQLLSKNQNPVDLRISWEDDNGQQQTILIENAPSLFVFIEDRKIQRGWHVALCGTSEKCDQLMHSLSHFVNGD